MAITPLAATVRVDEVGDVVITPIAQEEETGLYVREVRVFDTLLEGQATAPLVYTLRLVADDPLKIAMTTPALDY